MIFADNNLVLNCNDQTVRMSKKASVLREELDVKAIREAEARGPDYVSSFHRPPSDMTKIQLFRFCLFTV